MRRIFLGLGLAAMMAVPAVAGGPPDPGIPSVIQRQFDAFRSDDVATAFSYASPTIRGLFGTPESFGAMVRYGYPMVLHPADVRFLDQTVIEGAIWQRVMVRDAAGRVHFLSYQMQPTPEGGWQINGVRLLEVSETGA